MVVELASNCSRKHRVKASELFGLFLSTASLRRRRRCDNGRVPVCWYSDACRSRQSTASTDTGTGRTLRGPFARRSADCSGSTAGRPDAGERARSGRPGRCTGAPWRRPVDTSHIGSRRTVCTSPRPGRTSPPPAVTSTSRPRPSSTSAARSARPVPVSLCPSRSAEDRRGGAGCPPAWWLPCLRGPRTTTDRPRSRCRRGSSSASERWPGTAAGPSLHAGSADSRRCGTRPPAAATTTDDDATTTVLDVRGAGPWPRRGSVPGQAAATARRRHRRRAPVDRRPRCDAAISRRSVRSASPDPARRGPRSLPRRMPAPPRAAEPAVDALWPSAVARRGPWWAAAAAWVAASPWWWSTDVDQRLPRGSVSTRFSAPSQRLSS